MNSFWQVYTDGGARGNPGPAGIGVVINQCSVSQSDTIGKCDLVIAKHAYIGEGTNNQAEYKALILALEELEKLKVADPVEFFLDSKLVVEQVLRNYKMKNPGLAPLLATVWSLLDDLGVKTTFTHIPRERNKQADLLVNQAIDEGVRAMKE
jgi:ribonuclease HI